MVLISLLTSVLLATAAFAAPSSLRSRRRTRPLGRLPSANGTSNVSYSSNWAGAVWNEAAGTFKAVTGTITVPTLSPPDGSASAWVGIDGDSCEEDAILQTGIDMTYQNGTASYKAWYEWYPDYSHYFRGITVSAGDVLVFTVTATSTTSGVAEIQNLSNGQTVSKKLSSSYPLCQQDADWIVEDFEDDGHLVPLCDFGSVEFTNAYATTSSGSKKSVHGAPEMDIEQNGKVLTSVSENSNGITITYNK